MPTLLQRVSRLFAATPAKRRKSAVMDEWAALVRSASSSASTESGALRVGAVYACVRVIAETVASLPLLTYRKQADGGRARATDADLYDLLRYEPNAEQTPFEWLEQMVAHLLLRGNYYARIRRRGAKVLELIPLSPDDVEIIEKNGAILAYRVGGKDLQPWDVLHIRGLSTDGVRGRSVLADAADLFGGAKAAQEYGRRVLERDATPGLVLSFEGTLDEDAAEKLRQSWIAAHSGPDNAGSVAVLENGAKVDKISMTAEDMQFLETRKLQRQEIAAIFRVPPHLIGDLSQSSFSNIEQQAIEFVMHCIRPWCVRIEHALSRALLSTTQRRELFFEFLIDSLMRGDLKSRYEAYQVGRQAGFLSVNEIRAFENLNPIADGDRYLEPLNMKPAGADTTPDPAAKGVE